MRPIRFFIFFILITGNAFSQGCPISSLGQNPSTAFPVCGTDIFHQNIVPQCVGNDIYTGCTDGALYANRNPYWYKFTCYQSGSLGFVITPHGVNQDYDWQLFDVTNAQPDDVYTNYSLIVTGNWSGDWGPTGAAGTSPSSTTYPYTIIRCSSGEGDGTPRFETMPPITVGHHYLLLVSHFTEDQSGYDLSFGGGTAVITDPLEPHLLNASAPCDGTEIRVFTNKKMKCSSLAANGSDFKVITPINDTLSAISASSLQCSNGFDMDTISVFMNAPLSPGTYTLFMKRGNDSNTLLDDCDREIPEYEQELFTVYPLYPTLLDSITPPKCAPQTLELVFKKRIKCSSITGGDFTITGDYPVTVTGAAGGYCDARGLTQNIIVQLSAPMQVHGDFVLHLGTGPDGNTIFDECGVETPVSDIAFHVSDTVNADFHNSIIFSCTKDIVSFSHSGANGVNSWLWSFPGGTPASGHIQNPVVAYTNFEPKNITLTVSNGVCSATTTRTLIFDNYIKADFDVTALVCPEKPAYFTNKTAGTIVNWLWTIGNGNIITVKDPAPQIYPPLYSSDYNALPQLIVKNNYGCYDTVAKKVTVVYSCYITVPSAFTPNGDGLNDYLYPLKAYKSSNLSFSVYNRFGQRVFYSNSWLNKWDGTYKGLPQDSGTYVWVLQYLNQETGKQVYQKGTTILLR